MQVFEADAESVADVKFSPCGRHLATAGSRGSVRVWLFEPWDMLSALEGNFSGQHLVWSPDGRYLAQGGSPMTVWQVDAEFRQVWSLEGSDFHGTAFAPDGRVLALHGNRGTVLMDTETWVGHGPPSKPPGEPQRDWEPLGGIAYSANGSRLAALYLVHGPTPATTRYVIHAWDARSGRLVHRYSTRAYKSVSGVLRYNPVRPQIASLFGEGLHVWNARTERKVAAISGTRNFAFMPDGRGLVTANADGTARLWNTRTWIREQIFDWKLGKLNCIDVAPDGLRYAAGTGTGAVIVWDAV